MGGVAAVDHEIVALQGRRSEAPTLTLPRVAGDGSSSRRTPGSMDSGFRRNDETSAFKGDRPRFFDVSSRVAQTVVCPYFASYFAFPVRLPQACDIRNSRI